VRREERERGEKYRQENGKCSRLVCSSSIKNVCVEWKQCRSCTAEEKQRKRVRERSREEDRQTSNMRMCIFS